MLDVHAPHERMEGVRDFLLHLLTITVGLLIALSLEGLVEWRHRVHLVEQARESLNAELAANRRSLEKALPVVAKERAAMDGNLDVLKRIQDNPRDKAAQHGSLSGSFELIDLRSTAWNTAQATGALAYMPYEQAQRYASAYQKQAVFEATEQKVTEDVAGFTGVVYRNNLGGKGELGAEQASQFAERFGVWKGHLLFVDLALKDALHTDAALLEGKAEPEGEHEELY